MSTDTPTTEERTATEQTTQSADELDTTDTDLTAFQHNLLFVIAGYERGRYQDDRHGGRLPHGLAIKDTLETPAWHDAEINHGRLYPNLDTLVDNDLVEKHDLDQRTHAYGLTDAGWQLLGQKLQREINCFRGEDGDA